MNLIQKLAGAAAKILTPNSGVTNNKLGSIAGASSFSDSPINPDQKLNQLEQRALTSKRFFNNLEILANQGRGVLDGLNPLSPVSDLIVDWMGVEQPSEYWEGRMQGSALGMAIDTGMMGGGTALTGASISCASTTLGFCIPVAGPGATVGAGGILVGAGMLAIHGPGYEKAKNQYLENRAKETASDNPKNSSSEVKLTSGNIATKSAYEIAEQGGKYSGQLKSFKQQTTPQLEKSLKSLKRRLEEHEEYIGNPRSHVKDWDLITENHRQNHLHHWYNDISRLKVYQEIVEQILKERN